MSCLYVLVYPLTCVNTSVHTYSYVPYTFNYCEYTNIHSYLNYAFTQYHTDLKHSGPLVRDCDQLARILHKPIFRDVLLKASVLLENDGNTYTVEVVNEPDLEIWLMNSVRNLAQQGVGQQISSRDAADFVNFYRGSNQRPLTTEYEDMEQARLAVSKYHMTLLTWNKPRGYAEHPGGLLKDAVTNLRFDCTCHFFSRNAAYCEHILVVCHKKGIINVSGEIRKLEPVNKSGRPKKRPHFLEKNAGEESGKYIKPSSVLGINIYDRTRGVGIVSGYKGSTSLFQVEFPRPHAKGKALVVDMEAADVEVGRRRYENKNWH